MVQQTGDSLLHTPASVPQNAPQPPVPGKEEGNVPSAGSDTSGNASVKSHSVKKDSVIKKPVVKATTTSSPAVTYKKAKFKKELLEAPEEVLIAGNTSAGDTVASFTPPTEYVADPALRERSNSGWELAVLLFSVAMIAIIRAFNRRRFAVVVKSFFNNRVIPQHLREENAFSNQVIIGLTGIFVLVMAVLVYQVINMWIPGTGEETFRFFAQICLFIVLVYVVKFSVLEVVAEVVEKQPAVQEYIFNVLIFNILLGIALLPFILFNTLMLEFNKLFLIMGLALVTITFIYRNWRAIKISSTYQFPVYYIFLYLCTLEILPSIVLIKLLQAQLI